MTRIGEYLNLENYITPQAKEYNRLEAVFTQGTSSLTGMVAEQFQDDIVEYYLKNVAMNPTGKETLLDLRNATEIDAFGLKSIFTARRLDAAYEKLSPTASKMKVICNGKVKEYLESKGVGNLVELIDDYKNKVSEIYEHRALDDDRMYKVFTILPEVIDAGIKSSLDWDIMHYYGDKKDKMDTVLNLDNVKDVNIYLLSNIALMMKFNHTAGLGNIAIRCRKDLGDKLRDYHVDKVVSIYDNLEDNKKI